MYLPKKVLHIEFKRIYPILYLPSYDEISPNKGTFSNVIRYIILSDPPIEGCLNAVIKNSAPKQYLYHLSACLLKAQKKTIIAYKKSMYIYLFPVKSL